MNIKMLVALLFFTLAQLSPNPPQYPVDVRDALFAFIDQDDANGLQSYLVEHHDTITEIITKQSEWNGLELSDLVYGDTPLSRAVTKRKSDIVRALSAHRGLFMLLYHYKQSTRAVSIDALAKENNAMVLVLQDIQLGFELDDATAKANELSKQLRSTVNKTILLQKKRTQLQQQSTR